MIATMDKPGTALIEPLRTSASFFLALLLITILYIVAARLGLTYAVVGSTVTLIWAPSGIALVALLVFGPRMSLGVALGAFVANAMTGIPLYGALAIAMGNTLEAWVGALLLLRVARFRNSLDSLRDVLALIGLAALVSTMLSATVGVSTLVMMGDVTPFDYTTVWLKWWLGDMMGILVFSPVLLLLLEKPFRWLPPQKMLEALSLFGLLILASHKIFGASELAAHGYYASSLAVFPFVIWGALRFERWGASLVTLVVSMLAVWGTSQGNGPFAVDDPVDSLVRWCAFTSVIAATGLLLAALVVQQRRAQEALKTSLADLELRVVQRTQELESANNGLVSEMTVANRLKSSLIRLSEEIQQSVGRELHDGLGQHLVSLSLMCATLEQRLLERAQPEAEAAQRLGELIGQTTGLMRSIARGLYPVALEFGGLSVALEQLAQHTNLLKKVHCTYVCHQNILVREPLFAVNLYRIAQEAVANAVKYSKAQQLLIDFSSDGRVYRLSVSDDGVGLDPACQDNSKGLGMHSMRFRANLLAGQLTIAAKSPHGVVVAVTCHVPERTHNEQHDLQA
jgi:integral membrane sensor domain MASE1